MWNWSRHHRLGWVASAHIWTWDTQRRPQIGDVITVVTKDGRESQQRVVDYVSFGDYPRVQVEPVTDDASQ